MFVINSQGSKVVISSLLVLIRYSRLCLTIKCLLIAHRKDAEDAELGNFPFAAERTAKGKLLSPARSGTVKVPFPLLTGSFQRERDRNFAFGRSGLFAFRPLNGKQKIERAQRPQRLCGE